MYFFPNLEPVHCSMSGSNCCFLTCIRVSQDAGKVIWYSHLLKNFPQFVVIHTIKGFSVVNEAEVDVFLEFSLFFYDPTDVGNLISGSPANAGEGFDTSVGIKLGRSLEEGMATHFNILAWRIPGAEEPSGLQSIASQRLRHD